MRKKLSTGNWHERVSNHVTCDFTQS